MSDTYLIPQFIIDYLKKSKSTKNPQKLIGMRIKKNKTPEIEKWFKENEVNARYIWKYFVSLGKDKFHHKTCAVCRKRIKLETILCDPDAKYCSLKCMANSKEVQEKCKHTCLEKYGVENPFQSEEVKKIIKQTCVERYGVKNPLQNKEVQEKIKQTCKEKYGVENISQSKEYRQIRRSNYWETFCAKLKEKDIVPLFTKEEYINQTGRKFRCLSCDKEFISEGTCNYLKEHKNKDGTFSILNSYNIFCPHCSRKFSKKEKEVLEFVKSIYKGEIIENDRIQLEGKELDIYLPNLNLGIEFDGEYWHSLENIKEKDEKKNQLCEEKGIRLIRIKEEDWDIDKEKVKEEIKKYILKISLKSIYF